MELCFLFIEYCEMLVTDDITTISTFLSQKTSESGLGELHLSQTSQVVQLQYHCSWSRYHIWKILYLDDISKKKMLVFCSYSRKHIKYNDNIQGTVILRALILLCPSMIYHPWHVYLIIMFLYFIFGYINPAATYAHFFSSSKHGGLEKEVPSEECKSLGMIFVVLFKKDHKFSLPLLHPCSL